MPDNVAGLLSYFFTPISAIIFLAVEPFKTIQSVRFHSFQAIGFAVVSFILWIALIILTIVFAMMHLFILFWLVRLVWLAIFAVWIFLMYKAWSNEQYKLPVIGDWAEKMARG